MKRVVMTIERARVAAIDVGRRHAVEAGRSPVLWTRDDYHAACVEFDRICREYNLEPWKLP